MCEMEVRTLAALPYLQAWIHQLYLYACVDDQSVESLLSFVKTKAVYAPDFAYLLIPCGLLGTL